MKKRIIIYCVAAAIIICVGVFLFIDDVFDLLISFAKSKKIFFLISSISGPFDTVIKISLAAGSAPIFVMISLLAGNIFSTNKIIGSIILVLFGIAIALQLNEFRIQQYAIPTMTEAKVYFPIEKVFFEWAIVSGAALGSLIAYFIFRSRKPVQQPDQSGRPA